MNTNAKLLYISRNTNNPLKVGGNIGRKIHEDALEEIFGDRINKYLLEVVPKPPERIEKAKES